MKLNLQIRIENATQQDVTDLTFILNYLTGSKHLGDQMKTGDGGGTVRLTMPGLDKEGRVTFKEQRSVIITATREDQ